MAQVAPQVPCNGSPRLRRQTFVQQMPSRLGPCRLSGASAATASQNAPFGGAIVTKLAGSSKIIKGEHHVVPLLGPGDGPQPQLPFGASLECFRKNSANNTHLSWLSATRSRSGNHSNNSLTADAASSRMLDVFYVLAGSGVVSTADGIVRRLTAGDSLVAWHNTTQVRTMSAEEPPAVLKFHFPASVLMLPPGAVIPPLPSHADLQILANECQGDQDGELSPQEAADMLSGIQQRASKALASLYGSQQYDASKQLQVQRDPRSGEQPSSARRDQSVAGACNNTMALSLLWRRWLASAVAPAAGSLRFLRSALSRSSQTRKALSSGLGASSNGAHASPSTAPSSPATAPRGAGCEARPLGASEGAVGAPSTSGCVLLQRALEEFKAFRFPRQTNRLAFVFDPSELGLSLSFGVEVFEPGHHTPLHIHKSAHELFFVLSGEGVAFCNGQRFTVRAGDCVVFPPRAVHGIDNKTDAKLYCLQLMTPNEAFVEHVQSGEAMGRLDDEDLCHLTSRHC